MVTHARWVSSQSPYRKEFAMSGNVVLDPKFWKSTASYLHDAGVVTYEQDWLDENAQAMPNLTEPSAFLGEMAKAMSEQKMSVQYCMTLPSDYMASTLYPAVQTVRTSGDGFERRKWDEFIYDSQLASALGVWPWTDAFFSKDLGNLIISTLSAGPVGIGDAIGQVNVKNLLSVVRNDGVIIKPDTSLLPIDDLYRSDALGEQAPMVATASTSFSNMQVKYVFAYPRQASEASVTVPLRSLGVSGAVYAYNWVTHLGQVIPADGSLLMKFQDGWAYEVLTPINRSGLALLGDADKIAPLGRARFVEVKADETLSATIQFTGDERVQTITGYASRRPAVTAISGKIGTVQYDETTHLFTAQVFAGSAQQAKIQVNAR